jgi:hypothetical protein
MANVRNTTEEEETESPREEVVSKIQQNQHLLHGTSLTASQHTIVRYIHNGKMLHFPLKAPITVPVYHWIRVGGCSSSKWGPPPNMDGSPGVDSDIVAPAATTPTTPTVTNSTVTSSLAPSTDLVAKPARGLPSGVNHPSNSIPSQTVSSSAATEIASTVSKDFVASDAKLYKPSSFTDQIRALKSSSSYGNPYKPSDLTGRTSNLPSSSSSVAASSAAPRSISSTIQSLHTPSSALTGLSRPRVPRSTATTALTTISLVDVVPTTNAAPASRGLPANFARPGHTPYIDSGLLWFIRGGIGGDFEVVTKAELDDEFDVVENEGSSATNGGVTEDDSLSAGWEDDE